MLHTIQNKHWQAGILPEAGGSIAFGRMRYSGAWLDILRPKEETDYNNSSKASSFLMLPWANRIRDGLLRFQGQSWQLQTTKDDGTARHGDVRKRAWQVLESSETHIRLHLESKDYEDFNFPFALAAELEFRLDEADFIWVVTLINQDTMPFPAGFGFHPYFLRLADNMPLLQVPCEQQFELVKNLAESAPVPIKPELDFREARPVGDDLKFDDLLTHRARNEPVRLIYEAWQTEIQMHIDPLYRHIILFSAEDGSLAVEPQTNANDGFNLYENGVEDSGIFVLQPKQGIRAAIKLRISTYTD